MIPSLLRFLVLATVSSAVYGCTCMKGHHQEEFCTSDYVIRGTVIDVDVPPSVVPGLLQGPIVHKVLVDTVFKDDTHSITEGSVINVTSTRSPAQCGAHLLKKDYLIGGRADGAGYHTGLCDITTDWNFVPDCQRKSIMNNLYDCRCGITKCNENEECTSTFNSCKMAFSLEAVDNAYCVMGGWRCRWRTCPSAQNIFRDYLTRSFGFSF